jgi:hypothetical protein
MCPDGWLKKSWTNLGTTLDLDSAQSETSKNIIIWMFGPPTHPSLAPHNQVGFVQQFATRNCILGKTYVITRYQGASGQVCPAIHWITVDISPSYITYSSIT